jgi:hypothetical protein
VTSRGRLLGDIQLDEEIEQNTSSQIFIFTRREMEMSKV